MYDDLIVPESYVINLSEGTYYYGWSNSNSNNLIDIDLTRIINVYSTAAFITDPDQYTLCGSQVTVLEKDELIKSYNCFYLTEGFTRIIYLNHNIVGNPSRLLYDWYSSDEEIAEVTKYGTVFGKSEGSVWIIAVDKSDSSKIYAKQFTITEDVGVDYILVEQMYQINYTDTNNGIFRLPLEELICPYPMMTYYDWQPVYSPIFVGISGANIQVNNTGAFLLTGIYIYNPRVIIQIYIVVT